jgi:Protein of unknown function (DUF4038)/Putative collagen-binding domain of a collagenase
MSRLTALVCFLLPFLALATKGVSVSYVQGAYATPQVPQSTVSVSYPSAQTAGNVNVVVVGWNDASSTISSVTDSAGNAYLEGAPMTRGAGLSQAIYYVPSIRSGTNAVVVRFNVPVAFADVRIAEYSGLAGELDGTSSGSGSNTIASVTPLNTSTGQDLLVSGIITAGTVMGVGGGYTLRLHTQPDQDVLQDSIGPDTGPYFGPTPVSSDPWVEQLLAFKPASQTPLPTPTPTPSPTPTSTQIYPLKASPSGRYLVDQNNSPFLLVGDSPQALIVNLTISQAQTFFANRKAYGFNSMMIDAIATSYTDGRADASTVEGLIPFDTPGDFTTPDIAYWDKVDAILNLAAQYGMVVFLDPAETGGWLNTAKANGIAKCTSYGAFLGNRYRNFPNIVWLHGNDFQTWRNPSDDAVIAAIGDGIKNADSNHLNTIELDAPISSSFDDFTWANRCDINCAYTYYATYNEVLHAVNQTMRVPTVMIEAGYEGENNLGSNPGTPVNLRRQEYWTMLSQATGQFYGNHFTWGFISGWQSNLDTLGSAQILILKNFFSSLPWYNLIPDQNNSFVTSGKGTYSTADIFPAENDWLTAAVSSDNKTAALYMPTSRTITVNMERFGGPVTVQWFDPSNGSYQSVGGVPFTNSGSQQFSPPGKNSSGDEDWVLVFTPAVSQ